MLVKCLIFNNKSTNTFVLLLGLFLILSGSRGAWVGIKRVHHRWNRHWRDSVVYLTTERTS